MEIVLKLDGELAGCANSFSPVSRCRELSSRDGRLALDPNGSSLFDEVRISESDVSHILSFFWSELCRLESLIGDVLLSVSRDNIHGCTWLLRGTFPSSLSGRLADLACECCVFHALGSWMSDKLPKKAQEYVSRCERFESEFIRIAYSVLPPRRP